LSESLAQIFLDKSSELFFNSELKIHTTDKF
jgi:hypothetical protein